MHLCHVDHQREEHAHNVHSQHSQSLSIVVTVAVSSSSTSVQYVEVAPPTPPTGYIHANQEEGRRQKSMGQVLVECVVERKGWRLLLKSPLDSSPPNPNRFFWHSLIAQKPEYIPLAVQFSTLRRHLEYFTRSHSNE